MSYTKRQFIADAYDELGYASYQFDIQPEQLQSALRKLDSMMATWYAKGIKLGYPIPSSPENSDLDEETNVPDSSNEAICLNLAIRLSSSIGKMVSPDLKMAAKSAYKTISSNSSVPREMQITELPRGAGHKALRTNVLLDEPNTDPLQIDDSGNLDFIG